MADAVALSVKRVLEVFDEEPTAVRLFLPDGIGRLRQAASGGMATGVGRKRSERRRTAFECGVPVTMVPRSLPGYRLAILPLSSRGRRVGILEVLARAGRIEEREAALAKAAGDAAQIVGQARDRLELRADLSFPAAALVRPARYGPMLRQRMSEKSVGLTGPGGCCAGTDNEPPAISSISATQITDR